MFHYKPLSRSSQSIVQFQFYVTYEQSAKLKSIQNNVINIETRNASLWHCFLQKLPLWAGVWWMVLCCVDPVVYMVSWYNILSHILVLALTVCSVPPPWLQHNYTFLSNLLSGPNMKCFFFGIVLCLIVSISVISASDLKDRIFLAPSVRFSPDDKHKKILENVIQFGLNRWNIRLYLYAG